MILSKNGVLYTQIKDELIERIKKDVYPLNTLLPTETQLVEEFNVSKITVRKAIELLSQEGWVEKKAGKGTTIISNRPALKLQKGQKFTELLLDEGFYLSKIIKEVEIVNNDVGTENYERFGDKCIKIIREFYLDKKPYIYFYHYLPINYNLPLDKKNYKNSLYDVLVKNGIEFESFEDSFFAEEANEDVFKFLNKGIVLGRKRIGFDSKGKVLEVTYSYYDTSLKNYIMKFNV